MSNHARYVCWLLMPLALIIWLPASSTPEFSLDVKPVVLRQDATVDAEATTTGDGLGFALPGFGNTSPMSLIRNPRVQKALELSPEQLARLRTVAEASVEQRRKGYREIQRASSTEEREQLLETLRTRISNQGREIAREIRSVLTENQCVRLSQIAVQLRGVQALCDRGVQVRLEMTGDQIAEVNRLEEQWRQGRHSIISEAQPTLANRPQRESQLRKLNELMEIRLLEILTTDQQQKLSELRGEKLDIAEWTFSKSDNKVVK